MTHTPGPWIFHTSPAERFTKTLTGASHYDEEYVAVVSSSGTVICDNAQYYSCSLDPNNARLIAAAPELLAELISARRELRVYHKELDGEDYNNPTMNAVIAKATGEPN